MFGPLSRSLEGYTFFFSSFISSSSGAWSAMVIDERSVRALLLVSRNRAFIEDNTGQFRC